MGKYFFIFLLFCFSSINLSADSFKFNSFNNHGLVGLINMPTARLYDESSFGITIYDGTPDQKVSMSSSPFDWLEASFFYTNIQDTPYCQNELDPVCNQDYKDKGFNFKIRSKEEGIWPAIAIGLNDLAGTGFYSSEYIVASYGINKTDFHFGLGWGTLNGSKKRFKNPLGKINDSFYDRPQNFEDRGGQFQPKRYFSGEKVSPFFGVSHVINDRSIFKIEYDSTVTPGRIGYENTDKYLSFGLDFSLTQNFTIGISSERGNSTTIRFSYKNDPKVSAPRYEYKKSKHNETDSEYIKFIRNLNENGIGVNKIFEDSEKIGLQVSQFTHPNLDIIDQIIARASYDAGLAKPVKTDLRIADLKARIEYDEVFERNAKLIYQRQTKKKFNTNTSFTC